MSKPRVGFFDFASCEGCQLETLNFVNEFVALIGHIDIVQFREAITEKEWDLDVAFVEGSITREQDITRLQEIRENAKAVIALGSCACTGGVNAIKNNRPLEDVKADVYGDKKDWFPTFKTRPINAVIKVDGYIYGCPIDRNDFLKNVQLILSGKKTLAHNEPVCVECRLKENECLLTLGKPCMGPITRGGCGAIDPSWGSPCTGCRGVVDNPNVNAAKDVLAEHGLEIEDIMRYMSIFNSYTLEEDLK
ncbi:MAG TPA: NADH:ubiquinone oxidoreductase [Caldisericia bacterium]|nr:NADH:ubiquinone oxidoreductase [Caldisericia bacterium]HPF48804.1 NADH:ubiquinone oxidoreductase [Caldisericia bacterium]HPI84272.1 NADH:ubiquinone oxidoreductase [Caldisericia bacterium]HPQ93450.1 NADH:ubiquinone oxidoreductase [Caldisericia bacterium]HRV74908.1 NADH:ubiquinone oxidoreductase [Caldisericia bacterium]